MGETKRRIAIKSIGAGNRTAGASYKGSCQLLDLSTYKNVRMDGTCVIAQAMVTMEALVRYTLAHKRVPKVVAEFRNITVGGAISGSSLESTSHNYGIFMDTVAWIQVRKGDGSITKAKRGDPLWCCLSGTFGTVGIVLEAAIECIVAKPHVHVSYYCFESVRSAAKAIVVAVGEQQEIFLEGLDFPKEQVKGGATMMMQGKMVGSFEETNQKVGWESKIHGGSFYYEHVKEILAHHLLKSKTPFAELETPFFGETIPIEDFLFRYDNGAFWMARPMTFEWSKFLTYFPFIIGMFVASHQYVRKVTGFVFTTKNMFRMLKAAPQVVVASRMIVQDLYMPPEKAIALVELVRETIPLTTPIWLCPVRANTDQPFAPSYHKKVKLLLNCGIYGRVPDLRAREYTGRLEEQCRQDNGRKMLYAQNFYTEETFWNIHDKSLYDTCRIQHSAEENFPDLFEKTCSPIPEPGNSLSELIASYLL